MNKTTVIENRLFTATMSSEGNLRRVEIEYDLDDLHEVVHERLSLMYFSSATPSTRESDEVKRLPMLEKSHLPLLKSFYVQWAGRIISRLRGWISDYRVEDDRLLVSIDVVTGSGNDTSSAELTAMMIGESIGEYVLSGVLVEVSECSDMTLSREMRKRAELILNSVLESLCKYSG